MGNWRIAMAAAFIVCLLPGCGGDHRSGPEALSSGSSTGDGMTKAQYCRDIGTRFLHVSAARSADGVRVTWVDDLFRRDSPIYRIHTRAPGARWVQTQELAPGAKPVWDGPPAPARTAYAVTVADPTCGEVPLCPDGPCASVTPALAATT